MTSLTIDQGRETVKTPRPYPGSIIHWDRAWKQEGGIPKEEVAPGIHVCSDLGQTSVSLRRYHALAICQFDMAGANECEWRSAGRSVSGLA